MTSRKMHWIQIGLVALVIVVAGVVAFAVISSGSDGDEPSTAKSTTESTDPPAHYSSTPTTTMAAPKPFNPLAGKFPKGYPKKVAVADIPSPISSAYEGMRFAVQLAPGVYTALPPGAAVRDAALGDTADGYCASIDTYSRKFRHGKEFGGSCW